MLRDRLKEHIPAIVKREITARAVARLLDVSEGTVCRTLKQMKIAREPAMDRTAAGKLERARREHRALCAATMSIEAAARAANCSTRTIYRLRKKHDAEKSQPGTD